MFTLVWGFSGFVIGAFLAVEQNMDFRMHLTILGFILGFLVGIIFVYLYRKCK